MNSRSHLQSINNSLAIRQEIQRFESVHPSIYAIYDLIELVPDQVVAQQIRDHVVCIEVRWRRAADRTPGRRQDQEQREGHSLKDGAHGIKIARILPRTPGLGHGGHGHADLTPAPAMSGDVVVRERPGGDHRAARDKKAKSAHGLSLFVYAKWLVAERRAPPASPAPGPAVGATAPATPRTPAHAAAATPIPASPAPFSRMPENFLRSLRRRSLRTKKAKTPLLQEKRKSDSFVNSQEWTLSRSVPDLRLGIVGSLSSGKSALVHRYLTGSYMQEESPEGGRFKKEILVDGTSYLLLIRDEGGAPEMQFAAWVDAVIFVFSLENEASFNAIYSYYTKMAHFRNSAEIPLILVGTQDAISENNPRVIDDSRARKLATDLKRCSYYETCATYGLNVERVFQDACQKIVHQRLSASSSCLTPSNSRPSTPLGNFSSPQSGPQAQPINARIIHQNMPVTPTITNTGASSNGLNTSSSSGGSPAAHGHHTLSHKEVMNMSQAIPSSRQVHTLSSGMRHHDSNKLDSMRPAEAEKAVGSAAPPMGAAAVENNNMLMVKCLAAPPPSTGYSGTGFDASVKIAPPQGFENIGSRFAPQGLDSLSMPSQGKEGKDLPTPSSTPTTSRKSRRRSNLFTPSKKGEDKLRNGELGSGRAIPLKQGYLYKRSSKALNKEWKKKYVTLCDDGKLTYHPSLHDYMDDVHGKEISLQYVTVKVPGQKPRGSKTINSSNPSVGSNGVSDGLNSLTITSFQGKDKRPIDKVQLTGFEMLKDSNNRSMQPQGNDDSLNFSLNGHTLNGSDGKMSETPNVKKRHRRMKSSSLKNTDCDDSDGYEFFIVSLDNKQWHFEASNSEERDEWVSAIEQQILNSLQGNEISKSRSRLHGAVDTTSIQLIRSRVHGNTNCVDCDAPNPDWASLNLGVLMCIECSGIHRNLGSHISRVRSLDLDEWPQGHLSVMLALGNALANGVWEARVPRTCVISKPTPNSSREEKERWIRAKYEAKEFLAPPSLGIPLAQQLIDAVCRVSMKCVYTLLTHCTPEDVNSTVSPRDLRNPLHLACALGNVAIAQLLIWNNANVKAVDQEGQTCLSLARAAARQASPDPNVGHLIELLQSNGAPELCTSTAPRRQPISSLPPNSLDTLPSSVI